MASALLGVLFSYDHLEGAFPGSSLPWHDFFLGVAVDFQACGDSGGGKVLAEPTTNPSASFAGKDGPLSSGSQAPPIAFFQSPRSNTCLTISLTASPEVMYVEIHPSLLLGEAPSRTSTRRLKLNRDFCPGGTGEPDHLP